MKAKTCSETFFCCSSSEWIFFPALSLLIFCVFFLLSIKNFLFIRENWRSFATHLYETNFFTRRLYSLNTHIFWDFFCYFLDAFSFAVSCFTHFSNFFVLKEWDTEREKQTKTNDGNLFTFESASSTTWFQSARNPANCAIYKQIFVQLFDLFHATYLFIKL